MGGGDGGAANAAYVDTAPVVTEREAASAMPLLLAGLSTAQMVVLKKLKDMAVQGRSVPYGQYLQGALLASAGVCAVGGVASALGFFRSMIGKLQRPGPAMATRSVGVFMAFGTQGDVLPVAVVAAALARATQNYSITFITHASHKLLGRFLAGVGIKFCSVSSPAVLAPKADEISLQHWLASGRDKLEESHREECLQAIEEAFESSCGSGNFIAINFFALEGWHIAELYNAQCVIVAPYVVPYSAPSSFERNFKKVHPLLYERLQRALPGEVGWGDVIHWMWPLFMDRWASWRRERLHLSACPLTDPVTELPVHNWPCAAPLLYGFSREVVECPGYWPSSIHVCGFWFPPAHWNTAKMEKYDEILPRNGTSNSLPPKLLDFLSERKTSKPIFVGLSSIGSMGFLHNPEGMLQVLKAVLEVVNRRAILFSAGYPPLEDAIIKAAASSSFALKNKGVTLFSDRLFCYSGYVPYNELFPECSVVIHHGGSGTTAACLRNGISQIICPFILDQFYWAERMAWIGVAPQPLKSKHLIPDECCHDISESVHAVVTAVNEASTDEVKARATCLAEKICLENGPLDAINVFLSQVCSQES